MTKILGVDITPNSAQYVDQSVNMTAAASGSTGIVVADNDNINFGTGNFTLVWRGSLPDWTPSVDTTLLIKYSNLYGYQLASGTGPTAGKIYFVLLRNNSGDVFQITNINTFQDNTTHEIAVSVIRETATTVGSVNFYFDGIFVETKNIAAASTVTISNSGSLCVLGQVGAYRYAGTCSFAATFNRALSAAEVLDLYRNGIAYADKWGSQTSLVTGDNSTFASDTGWWSKVGATISGGVANIANGTHYIYRTNQLIVGHKYTITATVTGPMYFNDGVQSWIFTTNVPQTITATSTSIYILSSGGAGTIDNLTVIPLGATLALEPEGIQNDKWYGSANGLNASYPAAGWSLARNLNVPRTNTRQPAFLAQASLQENVSGDGTRYTVLFDTEIYDQNSNFANGIFTAPITGRYHFTVNIYLAGVTTAHTYLLVDLITSNRSTYQYHDIVSGATRANRSFSYDYDMDAGDTASVAIVMYGTSKVVDVSNNSYFSGYLVY
jgi:hypothetical protein